MENSIRIRIRPSGAGKWVACTGSIGMEEGRPFGDSTAADQGTVAHWVAAKILNERVLPRIDSDWEVEDGEVLPALPGTENPVIRYDEEMLEQVRKYTDTVLPTMQRAVLDGGQTSVEHEFDLSELTGPGNGGTADLVIWLFNGVIEVHDLKYGYNPVSATGNYQLACYAYGAYLYATEHKRPVHAFNLVIHQPRINAMEVAVYSLSEMQVVWDILRSRAYQVQHSPTLAAGAHCAKYYCKAQADCPALAKLVQDTIDLDLPDLSNAAIAEKLKHVETIKKWCDAVESAAYHLAVDEGKPMPGFKVVEGRGGNRKWSSEAEAEETLKAMRIKHDQMYKYAVISPTQAEKLAKDGVIGKKQWPKLQDMITRADGKLQLVPETDKRPAVAVAPDIDLLDNLTDLV